MLLRLYNDDSPLVNIQLNSNRQHPPKVEHEVQEKTEVIRRNSSSGSEAGS